VEHVGANGDVLWVGTMAQLATKVFAIEIRVGERGHDRVLAIAERGGRRDHLIGVRWTELALEDNRSEEVRKVGDLLLLITLLRGEVSGLEQFLTGRSLTLLATQIVSRLVSNHN